MKRNKKDSKHVTQNSVVNAGGLPDTAFDMVNRYGTYEIQATADTENQYPCIAQGFNKKQIRRDCQNSHDGGKWETKRD